MTTCSIIIPVHNRAALTRQCLDGLLGCPSEVASLEIVVVDDASSDSTAQVLADYADRVRVVHHEHNMGFAMACNDGAAAASGDWIVFLNNDTIPQPGWLDALLCYASGHDRIGLVGSKLLFPNDTIQHAGVVFARDRSPHHIYAGFPAGHPAVNKSREFQVVTGACALIRRELFEEAGRFDAAFVNGYEDVDLCLRLRRLGYEVHYCHKSVLYHLESATRNYLTDPQNFALFLERWEDFVQPDDVEYYLADGLMDITYWEQFPALLWVSPALAVLGRERANATERLLAQRSRQIFEALKENRQLRIELLEAEERASRLNGASIRSA
ncbi:MAG: glycosyltransferase family 2 protein [Actinomycetota bacterium]